MVYSHWLKNRQRRFLLPPPPLARNMSRYSGGQLKKKEPFIGLASSGCQFSLGPFGRTTNLPSAGPLLLLPVGPDFSGSDGSDSIACIHTRQRLQSVPGVFPGGFGWSLDPNCLTSMLPCSMVILCCLQPPASHSSRWSFPNSWTRWRGNLRDEGIA